ncbi:MAG TPA: HD domain-containing phosphohydrolase [candidate division Zixibacteria bacterium]|nr:HD domain-containing phosphohydrolase [candidate division Zixibacteria bacterium]
MPAKVPARLLVVDDEKYICNMIRDSLSAEPLELAVFSDPILALKHIEENPVDVVLTDMVMGQHSGIEILDAVRANNADAVVIIMTAHPTVETAISVLKNGAYDFLVKPFKLELLKATLNRGLDHLQMRRENVVLKGQVEFLKSASFGSMVGENIENHLAQVIKSCKKEIGAVAAGIILTEQEKDIVTEPICESDDQRFLSEIIDDSAIVDFNYKKSHQPQISNTAIVDKGVKTHRILVSQPIFVGRKLAGVINILAFRKFEQISAGELHILEILGNFAATAIANWRLYNELQKSYMNAIKGLANAIEARDAHTAGHTDRVCKLAEVVARHLGWDEARLRDLVMGCTLHDIGKIGVPDSVLNKPNRLNEQEYEKMISHTELGLKIIEGIDLFKAAIPYISSHHERFDGKGYPGRLRGEKIPIEGRLLAVADTFDAILSNRPYRAGASLKQAISELSNNKGTQFDPKMVEALFDIIRLGKIDIDILYHCRQEISSIPELRPTEKAPA